MLKRYFRTHLFTLCVSGVLLLLACSLSFAQSTETPLTSQELVKLVYQLPKQPGKRDAVVEEIRRRGLGFPLTDGMLSLVASKSGNDPLLRRTLEEAERRRVNPSGSIKLSVIESGDLLNKARDAAKAALEAMPDFVVKQQINRTYSRGGIGAWLFRDRLLLAISYRVSGGEEYKLLAVNGLPPQRDLKPFETYSDVFGGTSTSGEYVSMLAGLFADAQPETFKAVDTDVLRGRRTVIFEYSVPAESSGVNARILDQRVRPGYHGKMWIDRENYRVLRFEQIFDFPSDLPASATISYDYEWAAIGDQQYLLPSQAEVRVSTFPDGTTFTNRSVVRYRGYQKYGTEVKVIEEDIVEDMPEQKP